MMTMMMFLFHVVKYIQLCDVFLASIQQEDDGSDREGSKLGNDGGIKLGDDEGKILGDDDGVRDGSNDHLAGISVDQMVVLLVEQIL